MNFNVWNKQKLQYGNVELKNEDLVVVSYNYKEKYTQLNELIKIQRIDNCPLCYCNLEPTISDDDVKERVNDRMKLKSCCVKMFDDLSLLRESETYHVVGWTNKDNFKCHPLDIVSIYTDGVNF